MSWTKEGLVCTTTNHQGSLDWGKNPTSKSQGMGTANWFQTKWRTIAATNSSQHGNWGLIPNRWASADYTVSSAQCGIQGTKLGARVYQNILAITKRCYCVLGISIWKARALASGRILYQPKLSCPVKESQLDWEHKGKENGAQTKRSLPTTFRKGKKHRELKGVVGTTPVPPCPKCYQKFASDPITATNIFIFFFLKR